MVKVIQELCAARGTKIAALERETGISNGSIRRWDKNAPSIDAVLKVARYFSVSVDYLCGIEQAHFSKTETDLVKAWREADEKTKKHVAIELEDYGFVYTAKEKIVV